MGTINLEDKQRRLANRLHRLEGQVRSIEMRLATDDYEQTLNQFEAVIAAAKGCYSLYLETVFDQELPAIYRAKLIKRLVSKL